MTIQNAEITQTFLGIEDHNIFAWAIEFCFANLSHQSTGMRKVRIDKIEQICRLFECSWEKLNKKYCRIVIDNDRIIEIGHFINDKWVKLND